MPLSDEQMDALAASKVGPLTDEQMDSMHKPDPLAGVKRASIDALPIAGTMVGQAAGTAFGPVGEIAGGAIGNVGGHIVKGAIDDYREGGWKQVLRPPTVAGTIQAVKDEGRDLLSGAAQTMGGKLIGQGLSKAGEYFVAGQKASAEAIQAAAKRLGFSASSGMVSDSPVVQGLESSLSQSPSVMGAITRHNIKPVASGLQNAAEDLVSGAPSAEATAYHAGTDASRGVLANIGQKISNIQSAYEPFNQELPKMVPDELSRFKLADQIAKIGDSHIDPNETQGIVKGITNRIMGSENLGDIEETRKILGNKITQAYSDNDRAMVDTLTKIKDKLSNFRDDQFQTLAQNSFPGPEGQAMGQQMVSQYKNAMAQHSALMKDLEDVGPLFGIKSKNPRDFVEAFSEIPPEQVAKKLFSTNDYGALQKVQAYFPEEFETIKGMKLQDLRQSSLANPLDPHNSEVSPTKFIAKVNKLSPEVQHVLFGDKMQKLNDMRTVIGSLPENIGPSGTPKGEMFTHFADPTQQIADVVRYGAYKAMGSKVVPGAIKSAGQFAGTSPGQTIIGGGLAPAANAAVAPFTPSEMPGIESILPNAAKQEFQENKGYSDGGTVVATNQPPTHIDQQKSQDVQDSMRKAFHFADGGVIPGTPKLPIDSPQNDNTLIKATPGEVVLPLSVTQSSNPPQKAKEFMANEMINSKKGVGGTDKWAMDGFHNLRGHVDDQGKQMLDKYQSKMLLDPKMKTLLITASNYEAGSKPLDDILGHLKAKLGEK